MGIHLIEKKQLSAKGLLAAVRQSFDQIPLPPRDPRGLKPEISLSDCLMSAVAMFGVKTPSLLQFDRGSHNEIARHNLEKLYRVARAPCDTSMRERLDEVDPRFIRPAFTLLFSALQRGKVL